MLSHRPFLERIKTAPGYYKTNQPKGAKHLVSVNLKGCTKLVVVSEVTCCQTGLHKKDTLSKSEISGYWRIVMLAGFDHARSPILFKEKRKDPQSKRMRKRNNVLTKVSQDLASITCLQLPTPSQQVTGTVFTSVLEVTSHPCPALSR